MKTILQENSTYLIRFDMGEEVVQGLVEFASEQGIGAAQFTAIGAAGELVLSYYNLSTKTYEDHTVQEDLEITGVTGNVAFMNGEVIVHAHGNFSRKDLSVVGGHVKKLVVSATCEVHLTTMQGQLSRAYDEHIGLNLLH